MTNRPRPVRLVVAAIALVGAGIVLRAMAGGGLAPPPLTSFGALGGWADERDPATTAIALVRFGAEAVVWYLLGLGALHGLASTTRSNRLHVLADALALPGTQRLVRGGLGIGMVAATAIVARPPAYDTPGTATMRPVPTDARGERGTARMAPLPASHPAEPTPPAPERTHTTPATPPPAPTTWVVTRGESFWTIAVDVVGDRLGRTPADAEVDPYWRALVERNRSRLADPHDEDLILPGQVFELPATAEPAIAPAA